MTDTRSPVRVFTGRGHGPGAAAWLLLAVPFWAGCAGQESDAATVERAATLTTVGDAPEVPEVLASIGDESITLEDVRLRVGERLDHMENQFLQARHQLLDQTVQEIVRDRVLSAEADDRGMSIGDLVAEATGAGGTVTDEDIAEWYQANRSRVGNRSIDQIRGQISELLTQQRREAAMKSLESELNEKYAVSHYLEPFRVALDNEGAPAKGPEDAKVTMVEFSDFECPFCGRFFPTLKRIEEEYGDRIRIVYRQFPLTNLHPSAFKAAEASLCAAEQDRFWDYHDLLFAEQSALAVRNLKEKAGRLGLNESEFNQCLDTGRYVEQVQNDLAAGRSVGVDGTPALFVNGIPIDGGAVPFETVAELIDRELARAGG